MAPQRIALCCGTQENHYDLLAHDGKGYPAVITAGGIEPKNAMRGGGQAVDSAAYSLAHTRDVIDDGDCAVEWRWNSEWVSRPQENAGRMRLTMDDMYKAIRCEKNGGVFTGHLRGNKLGMPLMLVEWVANDEMDERGKSCEREADQESESGNNLDCYDMGLCRTAMPGQDLMRIGIVDMISKVFIREEEKRPDVKSCRDAIMLQSFQKGGKVMWIFRDAADEVGTWKAAPCRVVYAEDEERYTILELWAESNLPRDQKGTGALQPGHHARRRRQKGRVADISGRCRRRPLHDAF